MNEDIGNKYIIPFCQEILVYRLSTESLVKHWVKKNSMNGNELKFIVIDTDKILH